MQDTISKNNQYDGRDSFRPRDKGIVVEDDSVADLEHGLDRIQEGI